MSPGVIELNTNSSSISGVQNVGGLVGDNTNQVRLCCNTGTVNASVDTAGGVCGYNSLGAVLNSFNTGSVHGENGNAGGVIGWHNSGTLMNCNNYGVVSGSISAGVGGVVGNNSSIIGRINNNYFLQSGVINQNLVGIGKPSGSNQAAPRNEAAMKTDAFAYNLNTTGGTSSNSGIWSRNPSLNNGFPFIADEVNCSIIMVTFMNEESTYSILYSSYAGKALLPEKPTRTGYLFGGWYLQVNGKGAAFTTNSIFANDVTVYAYWFADPGNLPAFEMLDAEIRTESPQGLRFKTRVYKNTLFRDKKIKEYGTIILPSDLIPSGQAMTLETIPVNRDSRPDSKIVVIPAVNIFVEDDDYLVFTGVLTNIPAKSTATNITARSYIKYINDSNAEVIVYTDPVTGSLSTASLDN
jgi:uncharacterized repeat protein (TIGR02543 family)